MLLDHKTDEKKYIYRKKLGVKEEILNLFKEEIFLKIRKKWEQDGELEEIVKQVIEKKKDPYTIVKELLGQNMIL